MGYISCQFDVESISILCTLPQKSKKNRHEERKEIDINMNFDPILSIYIDVNSTLDRYVSH